MGRQANSGLRPCGSRADVVVPGTGAGRPRARGWGRVGRSAPGESQAREIWPEVTEIFWLGSGLVAGPVTTLPSLALNLLPWQGQSMVPSATWSTMHCAWVQTALKAL